MTLQRADFQGANTVHKTVEAAGGKTIPDAQLTQIISEAYLQMDPTQRMSFLYNIGYTDDHLRQFGIDTRSASLGSQGLTFRYLASDYRRIFLPTE